MIYEYKQDFVKDADGKFISPAMRLILGGFIALIRAINLW